jgi:hypothetical protein
MIITDHAAERYIERIAPGTSMATAKARLGVHVGSAARLKQKTTSGDDIYISDSLKCRLVVRGSQHGENDRVVITVLPLDFSAQDNEAVTVDVEEDAPAVPKFDLAQVMQDPSLVGYPYMTIFYVFLVIILVGLIASFFPVWRGSRIDPIKALRDE